ncbi:DUF3576 domain-containing protein [Acidimangrovimonas sediminis]|uniref:DUF3576 domain-containing protein n=1 Tax=Acidimangrovimonas sediminis TaxID=2056283 RepID=UPI000C7F8F46|nr:DUF3576 domain-containing protein [Acidimangrovimonas sediminis]
MSLARILRAGVLGGLVATVAACGGISSGNLFGKPNPQRVQATEANPTDPAGLTAKEKINNRSSIWDVFGKKKNPNTSIEVNKYIWNAALDVLNFLPVESVDPFSGVIITGYGTPPGGGRAYRATVYVQDPALDARSLHVALATRSGPVSAATQRAVEDAILTRARQLRIADGKL